MEAQTSARPDVRAADPAVLREEDVDGIAVLTLNRPKARNALSMAMLAALGDQLTRLAGERQIRAVVLGAHGGAFSAGHDLKELTAHRSDADGVTTIAVVPEYRLFRFKRRGSGERQVVVACDCLAIHANIIEDTVIVLRLEHTQSYARQVDGNLSVLHSQALSYCQQRALEEPIMRYLHNMRDDKAASNRQRKGKR